MIYLFHSWLNCWVVDPSVKHHTTTHTAITCCLLCSLVYSIIYLLNDLFISCLTDLRSCGSICEAPHHHTLCYNLLPSLFARLFIYVLNGFFISFLIDLLSCDPYVKHHTTKHYAITCCFLCSLVFAVMSLVNDLFMSFLIGSLSCGSICQAPPHPTLCYHLLLPLLTRRFNFLLT